MAGYTVVGVLADGSGLWRGRRRLYIVGFADEASANEAGQAGVTVGFFSSYKVVPTMPNHKTGPHSQ